MTPPVFGGDGVSDGLARVLGRAGIGGSRREPRGLQDGAMRRADRQPFCCPLCRSTVYERVVVRRTGGAMLAPPFYECAGCSVMFRDPERMSRCEPHQPGQGREPATLAAVLALPGRQRPPRG